jgi:ribulose-5-phosphate 4-epimerase/fuculose-1-phosphate aldolase
MQDFFSLMDEDKMSEIIVDLDEARRDLAAVFRWIAREAMHEGIANHFSFAVSDDGQQFLMNPYGMHFSRIKASDLMLLDARKTPDDYGENIDPTARWIHGAMHRNNPQACCIIHLHSKICHRIERAERPVIASFRSDHMPVS